MKFTAIALSLLLVTIISLSSTGATSYLHVQDDKLAAVKKLEDQLKELERNPGTVKVRISGKEESSANIKVAVARTEVLTPATEGGQEKTVTTTKTLDIDLENVTVSDEYINQKIATSRFEESGQTGPCPGVKIMQVGVTPEYDVVDDYAYDNGAYRITVWKGFRYDRASIPRVFWVIIDKDSLSNVGPLLHDLLYRHGGVLPQDRVTPYRTFSRLDADNIFKDLMGKCGVSGIRREMAYQAVRRFSWFAWKGK